MAGHDDYGKRVMQKATAGVCLHYGSTVEVDYGTAQPARIDATVGDDIAVEVESRTSKQVRGAVLDLICHRYPKKLLLLLPVHMRNPEVTARQCRNILRRFCPEDSFRVIVLKGDGSNHQLVDDAEAVGSALHDLGFTHSLATSA